jgi:hypothetical protein
MSMRKAARLEAGVNARVTRSDRDLVAARRCWMRRRISRALNTIVTTEEKAIGARKTLAAINRSLSLLL